MKRIRWTIEEVVAIVDVYFRNECGEINNLNLELENLSQSLNRRADILKISHDEKFRNLRLTAKRDCQTQASYIKLL